MNFAETCNRIFWNTTQYYHRFDQVDAPLENPYSEGSIEYYLCLKNWIDVVQWHLEDIIRNPEIDPEEALAIKRRIDKSNQERTDLVEMIDDYFFTKVCQRRGKSGCNHQYGKSGLGHRPSVDSCR